MSIQIIPEEFYTTDEVSRRIGVKATTIKAWRHRKKFALPFYTMGRSIRYLGSDVIAWREAQRR